VQGLVAPIGNATKLRVIRRGKLAPVSAHVTFENAETAAKAIAELEGKVVGEKPIHAAQYEKRPRRVPQKKQKAKPAVGAAAPAASAAPAAAAGAAAPKKAKKKKPAKSPAAGAGVAAAPEPAAEPVSHPLDVYVGNVPPQATEEDIKGLFSAFGFAKVFFRKGAAFVTLDTAEHVTEAVAAVNGKQLHGSELKVETRRASVPRARRSPQTKRTANVNPLKVWVGRLPQDYDVNKFTTLFTGVTKIDQHDTYAYITFDTEENATKALTKHNQPLFGTDPTPVATARF